MRAAFGCCFVCLLYLFSRDARAHLRSDKLFLDKIVSTKNFKFQPALQIDSSSKNSPGTKARQVTSKADSLYIQLAHTPNDTTRVLLLNDLALMYRFNQPDSAVKLAEEAGQLATSLNYPKGECQAFNIMGESMRFQGEFLKALEAQLQALRISRKNGFKSREANSLAYAGMVYIEMKEYRQGLFYLQQAQKLFDRLNIPVMSSFALSNIGNAYKGMNLLDSALWFQQQAIVKSKGSAPHSLKALILTSTGAVEAGLGHADLALEYYWQGLRNAISGGDLLNQGSTHYHLAELYYQLNALDSSLHYARLCFNNSQQISLRKIQLNASSLLVKIHHAKGRIDSAFHYQQAAIAAKDSLFGPEKFHQLQLMTLAEQQRQQQVIQEQILSKARYQRISFLSVLGIFLSIAILLWRSNRQQSRANQKLNYQKLQIQHQHETLEKTLSELKGMQAQLIQKEKVAALYEQQLKIQQVRNKIASELHDDIGSGLSSIHLFTEVAKKKINRESEAALPILEKIEDSSHEMMLAMNEIVWAIQPKHDDVIHFLDRIHNFGRQLLSTKNIDLDFDVSTPVQSAPMTMELKRNLYLICKETFNNIVKHSHASKVSMTMNFSDTLLKIHISDNGKGFDLTHGSTGNGLLNLKNRANEIGGVLTIDSHPGTGTSVFFQGRLA
jgi:signal transduction histidine kinase